LFAGERLNTSFTHAVLIDEIIIAQSPVYLGEDISVLQYHDDGWGEKQGEGSRSEGYGYCGIDVKPLKIFKLHLG
jgi:riboflavin biosynthesis pyrimidine reductase